LLLLFLHPIKDNPNKTMINKKLIFFIIKAFHKINYGSL
jgi:hypothetical protein